MVTYFAVYSCISLISTDIGKLRLRLMQQDDNDMWREVTVPAFSPVLRRPNHFQTRGKFIEQWMISKLLHGNTYVLKERDERNVVVRLYILDPVKTKPKVAPDGSVFYELNADNLSGLPLPVVVPASEIIHDVNVRLYHPLCGVSPLLAAALQRRAGPGHPEPIELAVLQQRRAAWRRAHAPGIISQDTAQRIKFEFEQATTGTNAGRMVVLGDGLKYEPMIIPAEESQLIEQLKWTAENVCAVFHVPPHMLGIGAVPNLGNVEASTAVLFAMPADAHRGDRDRCSTRGSGLPRRRSDMALNSTSTTCCAWIPRARSRPRPTASRPASCRPMRPARASIWGRSRAARCR